MTAREWDFSERSSQLLMEKILGRMREKEREKEISSLIASSLHLMRGYVLWHLFLCQCCNQNYICFYCKY